MPSCGTCCIAGLLKASWGPLGASKRASQQVNKNPRVLKPEAQFYCKNTIVLVTSRSEGPAERQGYQKVRQSRPKLLFLLDAVINTNDEVEARKPFGSRSRCLRQTSTCQNVRMVLAVCSFLTYTPSSEKQKYQKR